MDEPYRNGRTFTEEQGSLYDRMIEFGPYGYGPKHDGERRAFWAYWNGVKAVRIGLRRRRPPAKDKLAWGAFWAGFDHQRRRCGPAGEPVEPDLGADL